MIKKLWLDTIPIMIIISMFAFVLGVYFGLFEIPFLYQITTATGQKLWHFDTAHWLQNINGALVGFEKLKLESNPLEWQTTEEGFLNSEFWQVLLNNIAYMFNYLIYVLNIFLFIIRLIAYIIVNILCIIGFVKDPITWSGHTYEPNWLMNIFLWISNNLQIPFIQP